jgi:hypothetical protein
MVSPQPDKTIAKLRLTMPSLVSRQSVSLHISSNFGVFQ